MLFKCATAGAYACGKKKGGKKQVGYILLVAKRQIKLLFLKRGVGDDRCFGSEPYIVEMSLYGTHI